MMKTHLRNFPKLIDRNIHHGQSDNESDNKLIEDEISSVSKDSIVFNHANMFKRSISQRQIKSTKKPDFDYDFLLFNYRKMNEKTNLITTANPLTGSTASLTSTSSMSSQTVPTTT